MRQSLIALILLFVVAPPAMAMSGLEQIWLHAPTQYKVSEKTSLIGDISPRFGTDNGGVDQCIVRSGIQRKLTRNLTGTLGFDSVDNYQPFRNHENRIWQQLQAQTKKRSYTLSARLRLEERHFTGKEGDSIRARLMLKSSQRIASTKFSVVYSDELFLTLNTIPDGPVQGVDRNRIFAGLGYSINRNQTLECGYRVEYINKTDVDDEKRRQLVVQLASLI
ncbi:MAG: DUF2490 domain-containing protein [Candidatus Melainabacteria bacterium]|nr:DUF2490 domain-containing protein [Candidatus Melainabacteria bacterium]